MSELKIEKKIERKVGHPLFAIVTPKTLAGKVPDRLRSLAYQKDVYPSRVIGMPSGK